MIVCIKIVFARCVSIRAANWTGLDVLPLSLVKNRLGVWGLCCCSLLSVWKAHAFLGACLSSLVCMCVVGCGGVLAKAPLPPLCVLCSLLSLVLSCVVVVVAVDVFPFPKLPHAEMLLLLLADACPHL